ncbi:MAG: NAD(P)-dependent oxidoreductase [Arcobacteraceae bacterium]|jgi:D-3-phosphoglycerate dehydrogenase|nr:NAD(P)-dependent oxidoreductase [Arcobacteraceae bacterium]
MSKVYITDYIDNPYIEKDVLGSNLSNDLHKNIEVLLVWHEHITKEYIDKLPKLKGIVRYGVGFDAIDLEYAKSKNIYVCNTPDYGTEEVSDTAIAMIMNIARGISRYDYQCRAYRDNWQENTIKTIKRNSDYKLGIIGAGRIGGSVIQKANALRFQTYFFDPYVARGHEKMLGAKRVESLKELLNECDIVSINCPLSKETFGMINEDFISNMKNGASLVNTARGRIIKDIDLFYEPLKTGKLSNVALDVIPNEPPKDSMLINAWRNKEEWLDGRFILNPHTAYYSDKAYFEMRQKAALNAKRILDGLQPFNIIKQ